MAFM
jgi:hypothetical protein